MRLFIAMETPDEMRNNLVKIQNQLKPYSKSGNFTTSDNLHLTLKFLGEVAPLRLYELNRLLDSLVTFSAPTLSINHITTLRAANIVCAKLKASPSLFDIEKYLTTKLDEMDFTVEMRQYTPHITLLRKYAFELPFSEVSKNLTVFNRPVVASKIVLYQSIMEQGQPVKYINLYSVDLPKE